MTVLSGRIAIVTGGGRGLGRAIADLLATQGVNLVVADNGTSPAGDGADPEVARAAARAIGPRALPFTESIASPGAAQQLVELAARRLGGLDILVNAATIRRAAPLPDLQPGDWEAVIRNDLSAAFHMMQAAIAAMHRRGRGGRIVNLLDAAALDTVPGDAARAAAGAGLVALTRVAAHDLAASGIAVNAVACASDDLAAVARLVTALCAADPEEPNGQILGVREGRVVRYGAAQTEVVAQETA